MASLANLLYEEGNIVMGEDIENFIHSQEKLERCGIKIFPLGSYKYIDSDIYIIGHSFEEDVVKDNNKKYFTYNEFLSKYLKDKNLISICGSHGKTTLVALLSHLLNCSYLKGDGESSFNSKKDYFILESCEYQDHFLIYEPKQIILTNIDYDHVDYFLNEEEYINSFEKFLRKTTIKFIPYSLKDKFDGITIGNCNLADFSYDNITNIDNVIEFDIYKKGLFKLHIKSKLIGLQFVELLTFCYAFCDYNNIEFPVNRINDFIPASRRFNIEYFYNSIIIDDYAHHPSQIELHFKNLNFYYKDYHHIAIFKPDRFSRLNYFINEFENALIKFDEVYVLPLANMKENINKTHKIFTSNKIKYIESINEISINRNKLTTYSFMSSKEMKENIDEIKNILKKKD